MKRKLGILYWQAKISLAKKLFTRNDTTGNMFFDHELRQEILKVIIIFLEGGLRTSWLPHDQDPNEIWSF